MGEEFPVKITINTEEVKRAVDTLKRESASIAEKIGRVRDIGAAKEQEQYVRKLKKHHDETISAQRRYGDAVDKSVRGFEDVNNILKDVIHEQKNLKIDRIVKSQREYGAVVEQATKKFHDANDLLNDVINEIRTKRPEINAQKTNLTKINDLYSKYRKAITGVLIDLHFLRIVGQSSQVVNRSFEALNKSLGHLVDVILLPALPYFMMFVQGIIQLAGLILRLPAPLRLVIGALAAFTISLLASATMMKTILGFTSWAKGPTKRAGGGPLNYGQAAIVGERGPELLLPTSGGYHVVPNGKLRFLAEGTTDTSGTFLTSLSTGLTGLAGNTAEATGGMMTNLTQNKTTQNLLASAGIIGGTLGAIMAPLSGMMGVGGVMAGGFVGVIKAVKGSGQSVVASIVGAATSIRNILTLILMASLKTGAGAAVGVGAVSIGAYLKALWDAIMEDLKTIWGALKALYNEYIQPIIDWFAERYALLQAWWEENISPKLAWIIEKLSVVWDFLGDLKDKILTWLGLKDVTDRVWDFLGWIKDKILEFLGFGKVSGESLGMVKSDISNALMAMLGPGGMATVGMNILTGNTQIYSGTDIGAASGFVPSFQTGGVMSHTGLAYLHKGETVTPSGGSSVNVTIYVQGSMDSRTKDELIRQLKLELTRVRV